MSLVRMAMRFEKPYPVFKGMMNRCAHKKKEKLWLLRNLSDFFLILFYVSDHPIFFWKIEMVPFSDESLVFIDLVNNLTWLANASLEVFIDIFDYVDI